MPASTCGQHRYQAGCPGCRHRASAYHRRRGRAMAAGTWQPLTPAGPVVDHLNRLREQGMTIPQIADAAGIPAGTLRGIIHHGRTVLRGGTAAALLAVTPTAPAAPSRHLLPMIGVTRRVQALVTAGYTLRDLATRAGLHYRQLSDWAAGGQRYITRQNATAITCLFDKLEFTPGPSNRARTMGERRGWPPPLAWDPETIDDPGARPALDEGDPVDEEEIARVLDRRAPATGLGPAGQAALWQLLAVDRGLTVGQIRYRLGLSTGQVDRLHTTWQNRQPQQQEETRPAATGAGLDQ